MKTLIRRTIHHWQHWLYKRGQAKLCARLVKQHPELRHFDAAEQDAIRKHKNVSHIRQARKDLMTALLAGEDRRISDGQNG